MNIKQDGNNYLKHILIQFKEKSFHVKLVNPNLYRNLVYENIIPFIYFLFFSLRRHMKCVHDGVSTLSSSKLGLAAGFSALSPPEMLFRTWGGGQGGHCTQRTRLRGGWCRLQDCIYLTARPESSKNTHPGTGTAFGGRKDLSRKNLGA